MSGPREGKSPEERRKLELPVVQEDSRTATPPAPGMDRRHALKIMALAAAAPAAFGACTDEDAANAVTDGSGRAAAGTPGGPTSNPLARGNAWDPDLLDPVVPWEKILTDDEREGLAALCDVILPADDRSPSASALGCHDFIDEWVSAPYEGPERDLILIRGGLVWMDREAAERFGTGRRFRDLTQEQQHAICDDICYRAEAAPEHERAARFFDRVRDLTATAFYTTDEGMADVQYVGNTPLASWELPPPEVLRHLGLDAP